MALFDRFLGLLADYICDNVDTGVNYRGQNKKRQFFGNRQKDEKASSDYLIGVAVRNDIRKGGRTAKFLFL